MIPIITGVLYSLWWYDIIFNWMVPFIWTWIYNTAHHEFTMQILMQCYHTFLTLVHAYAVQCCCIIHYLEYSGATPSTCLASATMRRHDVLSKSCMMVDHDTEMSSGEWSNPINIRSDIFQQSKNPLNEWYHRYNPLFRIFFWLDMLVNSVV